MLLAWHQLLQPGSYGFTTVTLVLTELATKQFSWAAWCILSSSRKAELPALTSSQATCYCYCRSHVGSGLAGKQHPMDTTRRDFLTTAAAAAGANPPDSIGRAIR